MTLGYLPKNRTQNLFPYMICLGHSLEGVFQHCPGPTDPFWSE